MSKVLHQFIAVLPDAQGVCTVEAFDETLCEQRIFQMMVEEFPELKKLIDNVKEQLSEQAQQSYQEGRINVGLIEEVKDIELDEWLDHMDTHAYQTILLETN